MRLKQGYTRLKRLKYRRGHHVHSPFVFRLIEYAIEGREMTYRLQQLLDQTPHSQKYYVLLYRVVRHLEIANYQFIGNPSNDELRFVQAAIETSDSKHRILVGIPTNCSIDTFEKALPKLREEINGQTILLVCNLINSPTAQQIWRRLKEELPVRTSIDIIDIGLLLFDPTLHKQEYTLYH